MCSIDGSALYILIHVDKDLVLITIFCDTLHWESSSGYGKWERDSLGSLLLVWRVWFSQETLSLRGASLQNSCFSLFASCFSCLVSCVVFCIIISLIASLWFSMAPLCIHFLCLFSAVCIFSVVPVPAWEGVLDII